MQQKNNHNQIDPVLSFHLMKIAFQDYQKSICNLTELEYCEAYQHANEEMLLHRVILNSTEACCVVIPEALLNQTLNDIISEYPSPRFFDKILLDNNISLVDYTAALHNDLRVETVLASVASSVEKVTTDEMKRYFRSYKTQLQHKGFRDQNQPGDKIDKVALLSKTEKTLGKTMDETCSKQTDSQSLSAQKPQCCKSDALLSDQFCHELDSVLSSLSNKTISISKASSTIYAMLLKKKRLDTCRTWLQTLIQTPT